MKTFIITLVIIIAIVGAGYLLVQVSKPDATAPKAVFAQCLKDEGVLFYGAFWCPHCQAEKALFGNSKSFLPYVECSNADNSQKQICIDKKIEGYPTFFFPKEITIESASEPVVCAIQPGPADQPASCAQTGSKYFKTWNFTDAKVIADTDPVHAGATWVFPAGSRTSGELDFENLAVFSGCTAPTEK